MKACVIFLLAFSAAVLSPGYCPYSFSQEARQWSGVDETVVEKVAEEHGRSAREPFINTDQGDLLLFVFLVSGVAAGFVLGFYWRKLFVEKDDLKKC